MKVISIYDRVIVVLDLRMIYLRVTPLEFVDFVVEYWSSMGYVLFWLLMEPIQEIIFEYNLSSVMILMDFLAIKGDVNVILSL